jgi:hypothetical protein
MRKAMVGLALLLCLPLIGSGQSINYYPAGGGGSVTTVATNSTTVATSGTAAEVLHTLTLPANALAAVGDYVDVNATFVAAANGNGKVYSVKLTNAGGTALANLSSTSSGISVYQTVHCTRTGDTTMLCAGAVTHTAVTAYTTATNALTGVTFTNPIVFVLTGATATQAGDLSATSSKLVLTTN